MEYVPRVDNGKENVVDLEKDNTEENTSKNAEKNLDNTIPVNNLEVKNKTSPVNQHQDVNPPNFISSADSSSQASVFVDATNTNEVEVE